MKKFYKKSGRKLQFDAKEPVNFDKTKVECYNCHKTGHFARECRTKGNQDSRRRSYSLLANQSSCPQLDHEDLEQLDEFDLEEIDLKWQGILLESVEPMEIKIVREEMLKDWRRSGKQEDSKALVTIVGEGVDWTSHSEEEDFALMACNSSGSDTEYGDQMNKGVLSYENEVFQSVFVSRTSDIEDSLVNDRYAEGMHAVPPPMTGIYIPSGPDKEIDDSQFTYGPKQSKPSESDARSSDFNSCESNCSEETHESMPEPVVNEPNVAVPTNAARKVNTVKPIVKNAGPKTGFHKTLSSFRKPFNRTTALRTNFSKQKVNTAEVNAVSVVGGKRETAVKPSADSSPKRLGSLRESNLFYLMCRIIHKESTKQKVKKLAEEEATKAALSNEYDFIQARLNADKILAEKLREEEMRNVYYVQRAKLLDDHIVPKEGGNFSAQQRSEAS
ncbi:ribonuclease H-like domain-containing protein [Tanacetum coccineum]